MNQKSKFIGMFAILPLVMVALAPNFIDTADASKFKVPPVAELEDLSLVEVIAPQETRDNPVKGYYRLSQPSEETDGTSFKVVYRVASEVDNAVKNVKISVNSDTETVTEELQGSLDAKHSLISVVINAADPASINAEIVGFENKN